MPRRFPRAAALGLLAPALPALLAAQAAPAPPAGAPLPPQLAAMRAKIASVMLPSRQWRLAVSGERFFPTALRGEHDSPLFQALGGGPAPDVTVGVSHLTVQLAAPAAILGQGKFVVLNQLTYDGFWLGYRAPAPLTRPFPGRLHALQHDLTLSTRLSPQWRLSTTLQTAYVGDLNAVTLEHFRVNGAVLAIRQVRPNLQVGVGAAYTNADLRVLPALRVLWTDGRKQRADVLLPARSEYWHEIAKGVELGATQRFFVNRFALGQTYPFPAINGPVPSPIPLDRLQYSQLTLGPGLQLRSGRVGATVEGGVVLMRNQTLFNHDLRRVAEFELRPRAGAFVRVGARVTL